MTLVNLTKVLRDARAAGRGLAAFNVIQIEHAEAVNGWLVDFLVGRPAPR